MRAAVALPCLALLLGACKGELEQKVFPPGLAPLEDLEVGCPDAPGTLKVQNGEAESHDWTHGCAIVDAPLEDVFLALQNSKVALDQRSVDEWSRTDDTEPDYEVSFALHNVVHDIITVEFTNSWRVGSLTDAETDDLTELRGRYQMTEAPTVITLMEGSVQALARDDGTTRLQIIDHLDALRGGTDITEQKVRDYYNDVLAHVEGEPVPDYAD